MTDHYQQRLVNLQREFVSQVGISLLRRVIAVHEDLQKEAPYSSVKGFTQWRMGPLLYSRLAKSVGSIWQIKVYQTIDSGGYPHSGLSPFICIQIKFTDLLVQGTVDLGGVDHVSEIWHAQYATPESIVYLASSSWEDLLLDLPEEGEYEDDDPDYLYEDSLRQQNPDDDEVYDDDETEYGPTTPI